jgi:hypothetical protein
MGCRQCPRAIRDLAQPGSHRIVVYRRQPEHPTFSFRGATYRSNYVTFGGVETQSNEIVNGNYKTIATPTAEQQQLEQTYGADSQGRLSIPFIDFATNSSSSERRTTRKA